MYDEAVYVLSGRGSCTVSHFDGTKTSFEFGEGAFFVLPLNIMAQYHNASGVQPLRYFSVTNLPQIMRRSWATRTSSGTASTTSRTALAARTTTSTPKASCGAGASGRPISCRT